MRTLIPWRPAREVSVFADDFDGLIRRFFSDEGVPVRSVAYPKVESFMKDGSFVVRADLPGVDPKKVEVTIENGRLLMKGERETKEEHKEGEYHYREVAYGRFERQIVLPEGTDPESVTASYRDGVLEVVTKIKDTTKKIEVSVH